MEFATKYALVPEEDLSRHVPTKKQMSEFDVAMSKILNSTLPDHEKVHQYYELLQRKMNLQEFNTPWRSKPFDEDDEKRRKKSEPVKTESTNTEPVKAESTSTGPLKTVSTKTEPEESEVSESAQEDDYDTFVLNSVPKQMRKSAESLLKFLKSKSSKMQWNHVGRVTYNGKVLEDTNLAEMFHLIFNVTKKPPANISTEFLQSLREMGVPQSMIKNKYLSSEPAKKTIKVVSPRRHFVKLKKRSSNKPNVLLNPTWSNLF